MRTTLTIDDDVATVLERVRKQRDISMKDLVNDALRRGLKDICARPKARKIIRTEGLDLGRPVLPNVDKIHDVLVFGEGEDYK